MDGLGGLIHGWPGGTAMDGGGAVMDGLGRRSRGAAMDGPGVDRPGGLRWTVREWTVQRTAMDGDCDGRSTKMGCTNNKSLTSLMHQT